MSKMDKLRLLLNAYWKSAVSDNTVFDSIESYCMFLGYPRSGHSLVGSLLDAHPEIVMAHELDALAYLELRVPRLVLYHLLLEKSKQFTAQGRKWTGYTYEVPGQWQGQFTRIKIIGDKRGGGSTMRLMKKPELLQRLTGTLNHDVKYLHVVRNPFDNISTIMRKTRLIKMDLRQSIDFYFSLCETVENVRRLVEEQSVLELRLEDFIEDPVSHLRRLCHFFGVESPPEYLRACADIVFPSPHKSRHLVDWTPELLELTYDRLKRFAFLQDYTFAE